MARILHNHTIPVLRRTPGSMDTGYLLLQVVQYAVLGGIALFIVLAIVNTILGTPGDTGDAPRVR